MSPLLLRDKPVGSDPAQIDQVYDPLPPHAESWWLYGVFTEPGGMYSSNLESTRDSTGSDLRSWSTGTLRRAGVGRRDADLDARGADPVTTSPPWPRGFTPDPDLGSSFRAPSDASVAGSPVLRDAAARRSEGLTLWMSTATPVAATAQRFGRGKTVAELAGVYTEDALVLDSVASGSGQGSLGEEENSLTGS